VHQLVLVEGGEDQHPGRRARRISHDALSRLETVHLGHPDVHQHHVGRRTPAQVPGILPVSCLADDLDVSGRPEEHDEPRPHQLLVIDDSDPDHEVCFDEDGRWAATLKPRPSTGP
jgi:hypothetical protein